jgi:hypothetical protein
MRIHLEESSPALARRDTLGPITVASDVSEQLGHAVALRGGIEVSPAGQGTEEQRLPGGKVE